MLRKSKLAGILATAAAALAALFGSDATVFAQDHLPALVLPAVSEPGEPAPLVAADPANASDSDDAPVAKGSADSLPQLVAQQVAPDTLPDQMRCLATAIYFEAKGETLPGQLAVARVIINRARSGRFPGSLCGVVQQPSQFSFVQRGRMPAIPAESSAWHRAVAIAQIAAANSWRSQAEGALFFHAARVAPGWKLTRIAQVDDHIFYR